MHGHRRDADHERVGRSVTHHKGTRRHRGIFAHMLARVHHRVGAEEGQPVDHTMTVDAYAGAGLRVIPHHTVVSYARADIDQHMTPNLRQWSNVTARRNVAARPNFGARGDDRHRIHNRGGLETLVFELFREALALEVVANGAVKIKWRTAMGFQKFLHGAQDRQAFDHFAPQTGTVIDETFDIPTPKYRFKGHSGGHPKHFHSMATGPDNNQRSWTVINFECFLHWNKNGAVVHPPSARHNLDLVIKLQAFMFS